MFARSVSTVFSWYCLFLFVADMYFSVLGIRDILVRIRIPESVPLTHGSGSDSFLHWFSGCKKNYAQLHHLQSKKFFFLTFLLQCYFAGITAFHLWLIDPDPGGPKTCVAWFNVIFARKAVLQAPRKIRLVEANVKCRRLKKFTSKGTLVCFQPEAKNPIHPSPRDKTSFLAAVSVAPLVKKRRLTLRNILAQPQILRI